MIPAESLNRQIQKLVQTWEPYHFRDYGLVHIDDLKHN